MTARVDISPFLIHFTRGIDLDDAFNNFLSIIDSETLFGNNNLIKGGYNCVCFSEAPLDCITNGLINSDYYSKYSPFGILVSKKWLFEQGGRPVIYQPESEFAFLNEEQRWRHMTYNPISVPPIDFTWEREWRIKANELSLNQEECRLIVPNSDWANQLISIHDEFQDSEIQYYRMIFNDDIIAELYRDDFSYSIILLNDY
jgi:hypothetical protein